MVDIEGSLVVDMGGSLVVDIEGNLVIGGSSFVVNMDDNVVELMGGRRVIGVLNARSCNSLPLLMVVVVSAAIIGEGCSSTVVVV